MDFKKDPERNAHYRNKKGGEIIRVVTENSFDYTSYYEDMR